MLNPMASVEQVHLGLLLAGIAHCDNLLWPIEPARKTLLNYSNCDETAESLSKL
jgi:hypothetical protein